MEAQELNPSKTMHDIFHKTGINPSMDEKCIACKYYYGSIALNGVGRCCALPPRDLEHSKVYNYNFCSLFDRNEVYKHTSWTA